MVGETIDSKADDSGTKDPVIAANIRELETIAKMQSKSNNTKIVDTGLEYHQEPAYLNIETGRFTHAQPTMEKSKYFRITFNVYANEQILQAFDTSGGMHEGDVNRCKKQTPLDKSDVFSKEVKSKVYAAMEEHNKAQKKTASKRLAGQYYVRANNNAPKAPPKEGCMARLYKLIKWM